jgi:hypothetical protein
MFYLRSNEGKTLEEIEEEIRRKELLEQQTLTADVGAIPSPEIPAHVPPPVVEEFADMPTQRRFTPETVPAEIAAYHRRINANAGADTRSVSARLAQVKREGDIAALQPRVDAFGRFAGGLKETVPQMMRRSAMGDLQHLLSPWRGAREYKGAPDFQWHTPQGQLLNRASFESELPIVREGWETAGPGMEMPTAQIPQQERLTPSWDMFRANRPAFFTPEETAKRKLDIERNMGPLLSIIAETGLDIQAIRDKLPPMPRGVEQLETSDTVKDWLNVVVDSPGALAAVGAASMGRSAIPMAAAIATGLLLPGAATAMMTTAGLSGASAFFTEAGFALEEVGQKLGVNINDPAELDRLLKNPELFETFMDGVAGHATIMGLAGAFGSAGTVGLLKSSLPKAAKVGGLALTGPGTEYTGEKAKVLATGVHTTEGAALTEAAASLGTTAGIAAPIVAAQALKKPGVDVFEQFQDDIRTNTPVTKEANQIIIEMEGIAKARNPDIEIETEVVTEIVVDKDGKPILDVNGEPLIAYDKGGLTPEGRPKVNIPGIVFTSPDLRTAKSTLNKVINEETLHAEQEIARRLQGSVRLNIGVDDTDKFWNKAKNDIVTWLKTKPAYKYVLNGLESKKEQDKLKARRTAVDEYVAAVREGTTPGTVTVRNALARMGQALGINLGPKASARLWADALLKKSKARRETGAEVPKVPGDVTQLTTDEQRKDVLKEAQDRNADILTELEEGTAEVETDVLGGQETTKPYEGGMEPQSVFPLMDDFESDYYGGEADPDLEVRAAVAGESSKAELDVRDINNWWGKRGKNAAWTDEQRAIINNVRKAAGKKALDYRGSQILTLDEFKEIAKEVLDGNFDNAIKIATEFENLLATTKATKEETQISKAQEDYSKRVGKDRADVTPYRKKGTVQEYEKFLTPSLVVNELGKQLANGQITQEEFNTRSARALEVQETVRNTQTKRRELAKLLEGVDVDSTALRTEAEITARTPKIKKTDTTAPRTKAEIAEESQAAYEEARKAGKIEVIPPISEKELAEVRKQSFQHGTSTRTGTWNLTSEVDTFEDAEADLDALITDQGEGLGEGFEVKSTTTGEKPYTEVKDGPRILVDGKVRQVLGTFNMPMGDGTTQELWVYGDDVGGISYTSINNEKITNKALKQRGSEEFNKFMKEHPYWGQPKFRSKTGGVHAENVALEYDRLKEDAASVHISNDVLRAAARNMSPKDILNTRSSQRTKLLNEKAGDNWFVSDHVRELLGFEAGSWGSRKSIETVPMKDRHVPENIATIDHWAHNAINWIMRERPDLKQDINKYPNILVRTLEGDSKLAEEMLAAHPEWAGLPDYIREMKAIANITHDDKTELARLQQAAMLRASAKLRKESGERFSNENYEGFETKDNERLVETTQAGIRALSSAIDPQQDYDTKAIVADRTSSTLGMFLKYVYGAPVRRISDFNKPSSIGVGDHGTITMATEIANLIQKSLSSKDRPEGKEQGTDLVQEVSLRTGEYYSRLYKVFAGVTNNAGVIPPAVNAQIVDHIAGKSVKFTNKKIETAAKELKTFMEDMYKYAKDRTAGLETPLDLRGAGDTVLPRVWNIDHIATKAGKSQFLKAIAAKFTDPEGNLILEGADITPEDLYAVVINSGGFVQGEWTNIKADQTTSKKEIEKDQLIQEYLDSLSTEELADAGLLVDDLQSIIPRFVQKAIERAEYSAVFGVNDELLRGMVQIGVDQIKAHNALVMKMEEGGPNNLIDPKAFQNAVWDMSKILRNKFGYEMADMPTRKWIQRVANVEVVAKLPLVTLASMPEFFTPMLKGDVRPDKFAIDFALASTWAGYKGMNGLSKLIFNKHLPAMLKHSSEIGGTGIISDIQLLRESGIFDIQSMGDTVAMRYSNPNFARGGIRATTKGTVGGKIPKNVRAVFNMQTYMQATMLTTMTEMQQFMALRNYQRHMMTRVKFIKDNKGKKLTGRKANKLKQYKQDMLDYGLTGEMDLDTADGQAAFQAGALRFIDQVVTRPNDATTAKIFKNPLTSPLVLFKRFITTYGNTLLTSVGSDFATKVDNVERAKQVGKLTVATASMYGAVVFAEILRGAIKGDLDEDDLKIRPEDWRTFMRRVDRMGVLSAPGSAAAAMTFPSQAWYGDTGTNRIVRELTGPFGSDMAGVLDFLMSKKGTKDLRRLLGQVSPTTRYVFPGQSKRKSNYKKKKYPNTYAE